MVLKFFRRKAKAKIENYDTSESNFINKTICIVGCGGLGSCAANLLSNYKIKKLIFIDDDKVDISNLQRQSFYSENHIGQYKTEILKKKLNRINPKIQTVIIKEKIHNQNINLLKSNLVLDCTDNLETRFIINEHCIKNKIPWIYCSVASDFGFVKYITSKNGCLNCFIKESKKAISSDSAGILNTLVHFASSIQITLAIKSLQNEIIENNLINFNVWNPEIKIIKIKKNPNCKICGKS